jgi:outer membrane biosynthesis protein TonB
MTDNELSSLLQEWKPTAAPPTLDGRVFGSRRVISASRWDRIPAPVLAFSGAATGALLVWSVLALLFPHHRYAIVPTIPQQAILPGAPVTGEPPALKQLLPPPPSVMHEPQVTTPYRTRPSEVLPPQVASSGPRLLKQTTPLLPVGAEPLTKKSIVKLRIRIDKEGHVVDASVLDGDPVLDDPAIDAVKGWLYQPWLLNGVPTEVIVDVDVPFTPKKGRAR